MSTETQCAWKGCEASFNGDLPYGWVWLLTYRGATPDITVGTVTQAAMHRDTVLCPHHKAALERLLKEIPWHTQAVAGRA
jgi:hypothetical protein